LPFGLISTCLALPGTEAPLIPAMNAAVCFALVPIRIVADSPAAPGLAIATLLEPVVRF
jgi:hypothetical protein